MRLTTRYLSCHSDREMIGLMEFVSGCTVFGIAGLVIYEFRGLFFLVKGVAIFFIIKCYILEYYFKHASVLWMPFTRNSVCLEGPNNELYRRW